MKTLCDRIAEQLADTIHGEEAWHGDSIEQILQHINAKQSYAHPVPKAHSIWELTNHLDAWVKFSLGAVEGEPIPKWPGMPADLDWPPVKDHSEAAWKQTRDSFFEHHLKLVEIIKSFTDTLLEAKVPGRSYNFYLLFQSTNQHAVYHAGQIALLKKASS
jgi:hypothetical protein